MNNNTKKYSKEDAYKVLELTNSWIGNVDTKTSLGLAFVVGLLALIFYNTETIPLAFQNLFTALNDNNLCCIVLISAVLVLLLYFSCLISIIMFFLSIRGRLISSSPNKSMLFFGSISTLSFNDFKSNTLNMTDKAITKDILEQIHISSRICTRKFKFYNYGIWSLLISVILFFICMSFNLI